MKFQLLAILVSVLVVGCGKGVTGGNDESTAQQRRDAKALEQRFQQVRGTYEGTLSNPVTGLEPIRAKMILYVVNVRESANPDGSIRIRPALYGRFQLVDAVSTTDYVSLVGNYDEMGELALTSVTTGSAGGGSESGTAPSSLSLKGTIFNGVSDVEIVRDGGVWGVFRGGRTTIDASAPSAGDFDQYRERLIRVLSPIEGVYMGTLDGGIERVKVSITITLGEDSSSRLPVLMGQYRRLDFQPGIGERQLAIKFDSVTGTMTMQGLNGGGTVPGSNYFSGTGTWGKGDLTVTLRDHRGLLGQLRATRAPLF